MKKREQVHGFTIHFNGPFEYAFDSQVERNRHARKVKRLLDGIAKELELTPGTDYFITTVSGPRPTRRVLKLQRGGR